MRAVLPPITWCSARGARTVNSQSAPTMPASGQWGELARHAVLGSLAFGAPVASIRRPLWRRPALDTANHLGERRLSPSHRA
jgi:hypothetical protein